MKIFSELWGLKHEGLVGTKECGYLKTSQFELRWRSFLLPDLEQPWQAKVFPEYQPQLNMCFVESALIHPKELDRFHSSIDLTWILKRMVGCEVLASAVIDLSLPVKMGILKRGDSSRPMS